MKNKLYGDRPNFRPSNRNYVEFISFKDRYPDRRRRGMSQSSPLISFEAKRSTSKKEKSETKHIPRFFYMSSNLAKNGRVFKSYNF